MKGLLWRWSWREVAHGQLWSVVAALSLIIGTVCALAMLASRIETVMTQQGRAVLAADRVLVNNKVIPQDVLVAARASDAEISLQTRFRTMAFSDEGMQLVSVKAVESNFPLRGELKLLGQSEQIQTQVKPGELWLEPRLFDLLSVTIGDWVDVGDARLQVSGEISFDPELSFNPFNQMSAILIHSEDVAATGAVQLGGRVSYRAYFRGDDSRLAGLEAVYPPEPGRRWLSEETEGRTADLLVRAKQYLSLSLVLVVIMASATLALTCQYFSSSRRPIIAMLKSLGASRIWIRNWLLGQSVFLLLMGSVIGILLGAGLEWALRLPLTHLLPETLPSVGALPAVVAIVVALIVAIPAMGIPLLGLLRASAMEVMQPQQHVVHRKDYWLLVFPLGGGLLWFGTQPLVWLVILALVAMMLILGGLGYLILLWMKRFAMGPALMLALSRIRRTRWQSIMQLAALACSLMLLSVIWLLKSELLSDWQQTLPQDAPNVFALNVATEERDGYIQALDEAHIERSEAYPVIRGRLTHIGETEIAEWVKDYPEADETRRRELNLTWFDGIPTHNVLLEGEWTATHGVSIEAGIGERLGVGMGDRLTFNVNSVPFEVEVTSVREVEWRNMHPNFYFIFPEPVVADLPQTWLLSYKLPADERRFLPAIARQFPTVSVMDLRTMVDRVQGLLRQVSASLTVLSSVGVVSGLLLVFTLLRLGVAQRQQEMKLYRTLGASKKMIRATLVYEYGVMTVVASLLAVIGAELALFGVMGRLELTFNLHPQMWFVLPIVSAGLVLACLSSAIRRLLVPLT
ncbi:ABC transporter permease [Thaumasiovibrio subtropicus]|uniref:ABC transporter permease n=1 Tax=Thaumasiovibrio subtropicus TaxID=1891207 RepID=UPI00192D032E|nr:FtsX-like permease family protein [Thaumasiovibrio subtropicus]